MSIPLLVHGTYDFLTMFGDTIAKQGNNVMWILLFMFGVIVVDSCTFFYANWQAKQVQNTFTAQYNLIPSMPEHQQLVDVSYDDVDEEQRR